MFRDLESVDASFQRCWNNLLHFCYAKNQQVAANLKLADRLKRGMKSLETELEVRKYLKILSSEYRIPPIQFPIIPLIPARVFPGLSAKSGKNSFNF